MNKKAQLTIFLIIGIVLLIFLTFFIYLKNISIKKIEPELITAIDISKKSSEVENYVKSCISLVSQPLIEAISKKGGSFSPSSNIFYSKQELNVFCAEDKAKGCVNNLVLRQNIERELSDKIKDELYNCIDLNTFRQQGFNVTSGIINVTANIGKDDILVNVNYPLELSLKDSKLNINDFSDTIKFPLGKLYGAAVDITNNEILNGYFDKDEWMISHGSEILIEKHKPYPNIVYVLNKTDKEQKKDFVFQFAIKGFETTADIIKKPVLSSGCCINNKDDFCFKNTPENNCLGTYNNSLDCSCNEITKSTYQGCCVISGFYCKPSTEKECSSFEPGESEFFPEDFLCSNADCMNNNCPKTYIYPDRDFTGPSKKHGESWCTYDSAVGNGLDYVGTRHYLHTCINGREIVEECRDFREELCAEEKINLNNKNYTKAGCRLNRWYDCALQNSKDSCLNLSSRDCFWLENRILNRQTRCVPFVPPGFKFWENNGNEICDYASENPTKSMRRKYPKAWGHSSLQFCQRMGDCGNYRNLADELTKFGYYNPLGEAEPWVYLEPGFISQGNLFVIKLPLNQKKISDDVDVPQGSMGTYAKCSLWQAPAHGDNCNLCDSYFKPCTEYKCKSLGQCAFKMENGTAYCFKSGTLDTTQPTIEFDIEALSNGFDANIGYDSYFNALANNITPAVNLYEPITFGIKTSKPTICKISLTPSIEVFFGNNFMEKHNLALRFPENPLGVFDQYILFITCKDASGNENKDRFFVRVKLNNSEFTPIKIIDAEPKPNELSVNNELTEIELFVNKPFKDCRYSKNNEDYANMISLNCNATLEDVSYIPGIPLGSFICPAELIIDSNKFYFNCEDWSNNAMIDNYEFSIS